MPRGGERDTKRRRYGHKSNGAKEDGKQAKEGEGIESKQGRKGYRN